MKCQNTLGGTEEDIKSIMIILNPFPMDPLRDAIIRTVIKAEDIENIAAVTIFRFYTVEEIEDKRKGKVESVEGE